MVITGLLSGSRELSNPKEFYLVLVQIKCYEQGLPKRRIIKAFSYKKSLISGVDLLMQSNIFHINIPLQLLDIASQSLLHNIAIELDSGIAR